MSFKNANQAIQKFVLKYGNTGRSYKVIKAILDASARNTAISEVDNGTVTNGPGKVRELKISYFPMQCDTSVDDNANVCGDGTPIQPKQVNFQIKQITKSPVFQLNKSDVRLIDGNYSFSQVAMDVILHALPSLRKTLATQMLSLVYGNVGLQLDGNTTAKVSMSNNANGVVTPIGLFEIERVFEDGGFSNPFILGDATVDNWIRGVGIGGNNIDGQRIDQLRTNDMYYDALVNQVLGDLVNGGNIIAWDPQMFKFVSWNKNAGMFATALNKVEDMDRLYTDGGTDYMYGTLLDPVTGLLWDLNVKFDSCADNGDGAWKLQFFLNWDIFFMPEIACNAEGVNGIFQFKTCPQVVLPCPQGDQPAPPPQANTYSWTPVTNADTYIGDATIAGNFSRPNVTVHAIADWVAMMNEASTGYNFVAVGNNVTYNGYNPISGNFNGGAIQFVFA